MSSSKTDPPLRVLTPRLAESRPNSPSSVDRKTGSAETVDTVSHEGPPSSHGRGAAFWVVFASLSLMALLSAMEGGIMSTALPSISRAVNAEGNYVWIVNVYVLASAAVQPLYGQVADLWGTRWPMLSSITIFATGSAMCGAANDIATLIGGRTIQGFGVAGINILAEVILSDLLPMRLRDRDQFMGFIFLFTVLGSLLGPFLGGGLANNSGSFRSLHVISFILMTITMGIFTLLGHDTPLSATAIIGIMAGISVGLPSASILAVIRTALPNSLETANSAFALIRSISTAFAFSIPAAVFNNRFDQLLAASTLDSSVRENLQLGKAYQQASSDIFNTQAEVVGIYELSLKLVWQVLIGVAAVGIAASLVEKNLEFHPDAATDEEFGLEESKGRPSIESEVRMSGMNT
ncbi:hypothetical protein ACKVWC_002000 [Pyricularia oryzae]